MSDVELTDAEREQIRDALIGAWQEDYSAAMVAARLADALTPIVAARLSQEREQVRAERDREWRAWCAAMQDEWRALRDGVLSPGLRRAADDLDRDWSRQMVERRGRESFTQDGPRLAQEGEQ